MGQEISTINNLNQSINNIIFNILTKYSVLINFEIINVIIKIYDDKINKINSELFKSYHNKIFNNKTYDLNEFKNYVKNKILLIYKINRFLENCDQKLTLIYGSNWNINVSTNYKCNLDPAIKRPGRIDRTVHFDYSKKDQIKTMFNKFFPKQSNIFSDFYKSIEEKSVTTAVLQKYFLSNFYHENIMDNIDDLLESIDENDYCEQNKNLYM